MSDAKCPTRDFYNATVLADNVNSEGYLAMSEIAHCYYAK